jgi:hypothetical protein
VGRHRAALLLAFVGTACSAACLFSLGEVRTPRWCAAYGGGSLFCKDFDLIPDPGGWTELTVDSGTQTASLTHDSYVSAPYAQRFGVIGIPPDAGFAVSSGSFNAPGSASEGHLAFDLKLETLPTANEWVFLYVGAGGYGGNSLQFRVHSVDGTTTITSMHDETGGSGSQQWADSPQVGIWTRIFVDLVLTSPRNVSVHLGAPGSTDAGKLVASLPLSDVWKSAPPGFLVGIGYTSDPGVFVLVDNVVFSAK